MKVYGRQAAFALIIVLTLYSCGGGESDAGDADVGNNMIEDAADVEAAMLAVREDIADDGELAEVYDDLR